MKAKYAYAYAPSKLPTSNHVQVNPHINLYTCKKKNSAHLKRGHQAFPGCSALAYLQILLKSTVKGENLNSFWRLYASLG
jgi:hypothetical protein